MCLLICALRTKLEMGKDGNAYCAMPKLGYESNCYKHVMCFVRVRRIHQQTEGNQCEMLVLKCKS